MSTNAEKWASIVQKAERVQFVKRFKNHDRIRLVVDGTTLTLNLRGHIEDLNEPFRSALANALKAS